MGKFNYEVRDINLAKSGLEKIEWAYRNMPVLRAIEAELIEKHQKSFRSDRTEQIELRRYLEEAETNICRPR